MNMRANEMKYQTKSDEVTRGKYTHNTRRVISSGRCSMTNHTTHSGKNTNLLFSFPSLSFDPIIYFSHECLTKS